MSDKKLHILQHALGRDEYGVSRGHNSDGTDFRNHYVAGDGHHSFDLCRELVADGLMREHPPSAISGGSYVFCVTDAGKAYIAEHSPKPPKLSRSKQRYLDYLKVGDCFESFHSYLKYLTYQGKRDRGLS